MVATRRPVAARRSDRRNASSSSVIQLANLFFGKLALGDVANGAGDKGAVLGGAMGSG